MTVRHFALLLALSLLLLQLGISCYYASSMVTVDSYDAAFYYAVARNLALGRGLTENVVLHHLGPPHGVIRPAGEYWPAGWPLLLGTLMRVFGHAQRTCFFLCAVLSAFIPFLVFWLAYHMQGQAPSGTSGRSFRRPAIAGLAGLLCCLQRSEYPQSVVPDVSLPYRLACLLALTLCLVTIERDRERPAAWRWPLCGMLLALPLWLRGDGFVALLGALLTLWQEEAAPRRTIRRVFLVCLGALLCLIPYVAYNLYYFARLTPLPRSLIPWMIDYGDLFAFNSDPSPVRFWASGTAILVLRWHTLSLHGIRLFTHIPWPVTVLAMLSLLLRDRRVRTGIRLLSWFVFLSWLVPGVLAPAVANYHRLVTHATPVLCALAALSFFHLCEYLCGTLRWRLWPLPAAVLLLGCVTWYGLLPFRANRSVYFYWWRFRTVPSYLTEATRVLDLRPGDVVLATYPCAVTATLDVPAIAAPTDGIAAVTAAIWTYRPRYLLIREDTELSEFRDAGGLRGLPIRAQHRIGEATWYELAY